MARKKGDFPRHIDKAAKSLLKSRKEESAFWRYASAIGMGGWLFAIPVVGGAYMGRYLDRKWEGGISWTLTLILVGTAAGAYNLWNYLFRKDKDEQNRHQS